MQSYHEAGRYARASKTVKILITMRIGIFDPYLDTLSGGERYMLTAASCLSSEHEVEVFWDDPTILHRAEEKLQIDLAGVKTVKNIFAPKFSYFERLLTTSKYDRIFFLSDGSIPFTLAKKTFVHFQFPVEWVNGRSIITALKIKNTTKIICNSQFTKEYIDKKYNIDSYVLYPPCGDIIEKEKNVGKKNIILTVGRFDHLSDGTTFKKHEVLINVFKKMIKNEFKDWEFVIALSYLPERAKEVRLLEESVRGSKIKIVKNAKFDEIKKLYIQSKIYWHAAGYGVDVDKHPELVEHFGITTVEAMSYGLVPVVINAGGQKEIVDDSVDGYLWNDIEELAKKTKILMLKNEIFNEMAEKAREKSKKFTTYNFCKHLSSLMA